MSEERKSPVPVYTNDDLDRVRPFRGQTGVESTPAVTETGDATGGKSRQGRRAGATDGSERRSAEEQWRRSAEKLRAKLQPLRDKASDLREQIEERRRKPGVRPYSDPKIVADQRRLAVLEQRIRDSESAFEDRARRQGALPGWIR
jgi:predicted RNase H-like nuclease (RuvC/YqgF family)